METGDLDLVGLEIAYSEMAPERIVPHQVTLLENVIIKAKALKYLGVSVESLKDLEGMRKAKKETRGRYSNVQRIQIIGEQLVASGEISNHRCIPIPHK